MHEDPSHLLDHYVSVDCGVWLEDHIVSRTSLRRSQAPGLLG